MKIGIVGWGLEAQSVFRFFGSEHDYLIVNESRQADLPEPTDKIKVQFVDSPAPVGIGGQVADLSYLDGIINCDKIVFQPTAIFNLQKAFGQDPAFWTKATTAYDLFYEHVPTKNIIGITGTKGKGTTSTLIAKMLKASGHSVHIGGNIGTPILDLLPHIKADDWLVWELANFQLKPAHYSPHIAVCLMIVPEHLDWHPNFEDYLESKANIFKWQKATDIAVYFADNENSSQIARFSPGHKIPYFRPPGAYIKDGVVSIAGQEIIKTTDVKLLGEHNLQNICAAVTAVWQVSQDVPAIQGVLASFSGLQHRLELVREVNGVSYYDDSFGTTPETALVAIKSFKQPVVLIVGGHDKGADYEDLARQVAKLGVKHVLAIGLIASRLTKELDRVGYHNHVSGLNNMTGIVQKARELAEPGDVVLLSAGTSSFGMFKDYKDRGNQFKKAVLDL